jgi:hypothetical protein
MLSIMPKKKETREKRENAERTKRRKNSLKYEI